MTTHEHKPNGGRPWREVRASVAFPSAVETFEPTPLSQDAARRFDRGYRAHLIERGVIRPDAPARESTWTASLPCLPLRGIYRGDVPRAVSVEAFEAFEAHAEARAGWFPR